MPMWVLRKPQCFSALQRAENSQSGSPLPSPTLRSGVSVLFSEPKILNRLRFAAHAAAVCAVSVLFSEPKILNAHTAARMRLVRQVSVLFSEPKILNRRCCVVTLLLDQVSVLFSEPKILNLQRVWRPAYGSRFQCSSASRKFSISPVASTRISKLRFQCSSASRKFSIGSVAASRQQTYNVSVLFSEPKILNPDPRTCVHPYFRPR